MRKWVPLTPEQQQFATEHHGLLLKFMGTHGKDLIALSGVSQSSISKMGRGENVNTDILNRICISLNCSIADVIEVLPEENGESSSTSEQSD